MRVKWLQAARKSLDRIVEYLSEDAPVTATKIYQHIRSRADSLQNQPGQGRPGRVYGTRELVIEKYPYIVPYRVKDNEIQILRVFHTSRKPPNEW